MQQSHVTDATLVLYVTWVMPCFLGQFVDILDDEVDGLDLRIPWTAPVPPSFSSPFVLTIPVWPLGWPSQSSGETLHVLPSRQVCS